MHDEVLTGTADGFLDALAAAIVDGVDACYARLRELREALFTEARATVSRLIQSRSLAAGSVLPLQYGVFVCSSNFRCASDLLRIWATTTREALPHCIPGPLRFVDGRQT